MQRLAAALEQAVIGRVLDQRVLEAIGRLRRHRPRRTGCRPRRADPARTAEPPSSRSATSLEQRDARIRVPSTAPICAISARGAEPVEPRGERLLQGRRDRLRAALYAALQSRRVTSSTNSGTPPVRSFTPFDDLPGQRMARGDFADHLRDLRAIERRERDDAMVRAHAPGRTELRPRRRDDEQRRLGAALGQRAA